MNVKDEFFFELCVAFFTIWMMVVCEAPKNMKGLKSEKICFSIRKIETQNDVLSGCMAKQKYASITTVLCYFQYVYTERC